MFDLVDTHGVPLDVVVQLLDERGYVPDWLHFYRRGVEAGWRPDGIVSKLESAVVDVYGPDWRDRWKETFLATIE